MKIEDILNNKVNSEKVKAQMDAYGIENPTYRDVVNVSVINAAINGDARCALYLLENADNEKDYMKNTVLGDIQKSRKEKSKKKAVNAKNRSTKSKN